MNQEDLVVDTVSVLRNLQRIINHLSKSIKKDGADIDKDKIGKLALVTNTYSRLLQVQHTLDVYADENAPTYHDLLEENLRAQRKRRNEDE